MKTRKFLWSAFLGVLLCFGSVSASAQGKVSVMPYLKTDYVVVSVLNEEPADFSLKIRDNSGNVFYSSMKVSGTLHYNKIFDFSDLDDGAYEVVLKKSDQAVLTDAFSILDGKLHSAEKKSEKLNAQVWSSKDYIFVSYLNKGADAYSMRIADETGDLLYESFLPESLTYSGKFDVSSLPSGRYVLSLTSGKNASRYEFTK